MPVRFSGAVNVGGATGVARTGDAATPVPIAFTAETRNEYCVPFVRPITVAARAVDAVCAKTVHVELVLTAYSTL